MYEYDATEGYHVETDETEKETMRYLSDVEQQADTWKVERLLIGMIMPLCKW